MEDKVLSSCSICGKKVNLKRCSRCKNIFYCSREHQLQDWKTHKLECSETLDKGHSNKSSQASTQALGTSSSATSAPIAASDNSRSFDPRPLKITEFPQPKSKDVDTLIEFASEQLKSNGYCVIDNILSDNECNEVLTDVKRIESRGLMKEGQLAGGRTSGVDSEKVVNKDIRNDRITWLQGDEEEYPAISNWVHDKLDSIVVNLSVYFDGKYIIGRRTKAMVACYPGNGAGYMKHVDNPKKDGRCITCIFYLNRDWDVQKQGGLLRIFPSHQPEEYVDVAPLMNRLLLFWSDGRNPHEVQPAYDTRYAITVWYFDEAERQKAKQESVDQELAQVRGDIAQLEIKKKQVEKAVLEQQIENESTRAVGLLSGEELEAIAKLVENHPDPHTLLGSMGIGPNIREHLLKEIHALSKS